MRRDGLPFVSSSSFLARPPAVAPARLTFAIAILLVVVPAVRAQTRRTLYYVGPDNGLFTDAANWSISLDGPGGDGPPHHDLSYDDSAYIQPMSSHSVLLKSNASAHFVGVNAQTPDTAITLVQSAGELSTNALSIFAAPGATASFVQTGGAVDGASLGYFDVSAAVGGTAAVTIAGGGVSGSVVDIGGAGTVTVTQSSGSVSGYTDVRLAADADTSVTYVLSGGYLGGDALTVGRLGTATLRQSGGRTYGYYGIAVGPGSTYDMTGGSIDQTHAYADTLSVAGNFSIAGSAAVTAERLYLDSTGIFTQSGGSVAFSFTSFNGQVAISGGTTLFGSLVNDGTFRQTGGDLTTFYLSGVGAFDISAGSLAPKVFRQSALSATGTASIRLTPYPYMSSRVSSLSLAESARLDITANTFLIDYALSSPIDRIRQYIRDGLLASSAADPLQTLACIESADLTEGRRDAVAGEPVDATTLIVRLALIGDANFDGTVDDADYALLFAGRSLPHPTWCQGDFNLDSLVNSADYLLIDRTFALTTGLPPTLLESRRAEFGNAYVSALLNSLPEPSLSLLLFIPASVARAQCRRSHGA